VPNANHTNLENKPG